jgi:hypothetical protein
MDRRRLIQFGVWGVFAVLAAVLLISVLSNGGDDNSSESEAETSTASAVIVSADALREKATEREGPIYWAGEQAGAQIEFSQPQAGRTYVRYLTGGAEAGDPSAEFLTVGTYAFKDAAKALREQAKHPNGVLASAPGGGVVYFDTTHPQSVYLAYPGEEAQIEVYDPNPKRSLGLVSSGLIVPVG